MTLLNWQRSLEHLVVANDKHRILGLTSIHHGAGVSMICRGMAKIFSEGGKRTLITNLSQMSAKVPSNVGNSQMSIGSTLRSSIKKTAHGYDIMPGDEDNKSIALDVHQLQLALRTDLSEYDRIILDLAPIYDDIDSGMRTSSVAPMCDGVLLVCVIGTDSNAEVKEAASLLKGSGAKLTGVISNEYKSKDPWGFLRKMKLLQGLEIERARM